MKMCDLHENRSEGRTHSQMNGFAKRLSLDTEAKGNWEMAFPNDS